MVSDPVHVTKERTDISRATARDFWPCSNIVPVMNLVFLSVAIARFLLNPGAC